MDYKKKYLKYKNKYLQLKELLGGDKEEKRKKKEEKEKEQEIQQRHEIEIWRNSGNNTTNWKKTKKDARDTIIQYNKLKKKYPSDIAVEMAKNKFTDEKFNIYDEHIKIYPPEDSFLFTLYTFNNDNIRDYNTYINKYPKLGLNKDIKLELANKINTIKDINNRDQEIEYLSNNTYIVK